MSTCIVTSQKDPITLNNKVLGEFPELYHSKISFAEENNILYCETGVKLEDNTVQFQGSDSLIYLSTNRHNYKLSVSIYNGSTLMMGKHNYINGKLNLILSEGKNIIIGNDGLFSFGIWMRLADPHLIYDSETMKRINPSKSIYIGDHVWIGQNALILKGTRIGSGCIIGAMSVLSGKKYPSNTIWCGNPARQVKKDVFWLGDCVHNYLPSDTASVETSANGAFLYSNRPKEILNLEEIELQLSKDKTAAGRLEFLRSIFCNTMEHNRFYIISAETTAM